MTATIAAPPKMSALDGGRHHGIDWCVCRAPIWGAVNGYVRIPEDHPWGGMGYDEIHESDPHLEVNGGLTFARDGWIGFDTLHAGDYWPGERSHFCSAGDCYCTHWTQDMVADETKRLAERVALIGGHPTRRGHPMTADLRLVTDHDTYLGRDTAAGVDILLRVWPDGYRTASTRPIGGHGWSPEVELRATGGAS